MEASASAILGRASSKEEPGVDKKLTVVTGKDGDISTSAHENAYVAAKFLDGDSSGCGSFAGGLHEPSSWSK